MELTRESFTVETNTQENIQSTFGIKDPAIVFDILVTKLYENPLKTVVQEYMCNARDSHREAGNEDAPIMVILPTHIDPTLKIRDFGVGISPQRMNDVFIFLGESTKNKSNHQTGGFGVGAKTAWAYTDSFTIHTIYNGIEYVYLAYIGDGRIGKLDLLSETTTNESNGTTIEISIAPRDFEKTEIYVYRTSHFWTTRPIIKNNSFIQEYGETTHITKDGETIASVVNNIVKHPYLSELSGSVMVVLDGIIYRSFGDSDISGDKLYLIGRHCSATFVHFKTGDLTPSITRDNIMIDDHSKKVFCDYQENIINEIASDFTAGVNNSNTIWELKDFINTFDLEKLGIISHWSFMFKDVKITYSSGKFYIRLNEYNLYQGRYNYYTDVNVLRYEDSSGTLYLNDIDKSTLIVNDKCTKTMNRVTVKAFCSTYNTANTDPDPSKPVRTVNSFHINVVNVKPATTNPVSDGRHKIIYDMLKDADVETLTTINNKFKNGVVKAGVVVPKPIRIQNVNPYNGRRSWAIFTELVDTYKYFIIKTDNSYDSEITNIIYQYNLNFDDEPIGIIKGTNKVIEAITTGPFSDMIKTNDEIFEIMVEATTTKITTKDMMAHISNDLYFEDIDRLNILIDVADSINDKGFVNWLKKHTNFYNKFRQNRGSHNRIGNLYRMLNNKNGSNISNTRYDRLKNCITKKNTSWKDGLAKIIDKYPFILYSYSRHSSMKTHFIDYINAMYMMHETNIKKGDY